jgi:hypothetical protein
MTGSGNIQGDFDQRVVGAQCHRLGDRLATK